MGRRVSVTSLRRASVVISVAFLLVLVPPLVTVLGAAIVDAGVVGWLDGARRVLQRASTWRSVRFSVLQATASAAISVLVALPGAYWLAHVQFPGKRLIQSATLIPFVMPSLIVILAVITFYGRAGVLSTLSGLNLTFVYSAVGIIVAHVMFNVSVALRILAGGWLHVDERYREVAACLGERPLSRLLHLHFPLLLPSAVSAFIIIFLYCFVSFGVVLVFGGVRYATTEVRIYQEMFTNLDLTAAGVLAALQLLVCGLLVAAVQLVSRRRHSLTYSRGRVFVVRPWQSLRPAVRGLAATYWILLSLFLFGPLLAIISRAVSYRGGIDFDSFRALLGGTVGNRDVSEIMRAGFLELLSTSIGVALLSATVTAVLAFFAARVLRDSGPGFVDTVLTLPLAVSGVTLSLGLRLLLFGSIPTIALIVIAQTVLSFPLVFRSIRTHMRALPSRYGETARSLGAGPLYRIITVEIPVLWRGLLNAFAFAFAVSLADFTSVLTIGRGEIVTFPIALYRLIGFQSFDVALALGVVYMLIVGVVFAAIDATSYRKEQHGL